MIRLIGAGLVLTLISCNRDVLVSEEWTWKDRSWSVDDAKTISIEGGDTTTVYRMDLSIGHDEGYPFQNLYVRTVTTFPSGKEVSSVTSLELMEKTGGWAGKCSGGTCVLELPLQQRFTFPETGTFQWSVTPYMRTDTVHGIKSLTVTCRRVKE